MTQPISPYHRPGFYADALAKGRHRDIVGGRWDETGRAQMALLLAAGLQPHHHLLDIGAGALRLGCKVVPYLDPGHYWGTDLSGALMAAGHAQELADPARLDPSHLIEDPDFTFPGIPQTVTHALAFAVFTHLPLAHLHRALTRIQTRFPALQQLFFTVFLAPVNHAGPFRQPDGAVSHANRAPYHFSAATVLDLAHDTGFHAHLTTDRLPRGQTLVRASRR